MHLFFVAASDVETKIVAVLIQLSVIILAARVAALTARKLGQPAVVGEIIAGLLLGPSLLGRSGFTWFISIGQRSSSPPTPCWRA